MSENKETLSWPRAEPRGFKSEDKDKGKATRQYAKLLFLTLRGVVRILLCSFMLLLHQLVVLLRCRSGLVCDVI